MKRTTLLPNPPVGNHPIYTKDKPSEVFIRTICDSASPVSECQLCGRIHFDSGGDNMDEGELDRLLHKQKRNPDKYCNHDHNPWYGQMDGKRVVADCPCNGLTLFENLFIKEDYQIAKYLQARSEQLESEAKEAAKIAEVARKAIH